MHLSRLAAASLSAVLVCGCNPDTMGGFLEPPGGVTRNAETVAVAKGQAAKIDWFYSLNLDCTELPGVSGQLRH